MAYYGGTANERPWPKVDGRFVLGIVVVVLAWAGLGYFFLKDNISSISLSPPAETPASSLALVAAQDIAEGERIDTVQLRREAWSGSAEDPQPLHELEMGKITFAAEKIPAGKAITPGMLRVVSPVTAITAKIPEGYRAVTLSVDAESGVEGWVRPGTHVDVVWTTMHQSHPAVTTIVQSAQVLSAERSMDIPVDSKTPTAKVPSHVTLLVSSKDAQKVQLARSSGTLSLVLRGDSDVSVASNDMLSASSLLKESGIDSEGESQGTVQYDNRSFEVRGGRLIRVPPTEGSESSLGK